MAVGTVVEVTPRDGGVHASIDVGALDLADVMAGDSIAVNGVCLTAVDHTAHTFEVDISAETQRCTTGFRAGQRVNLEKALRLADRLGGHLVSGHVDGIGRVVLFEAAGESRRLEIEVPDDLARYIAAKGSVCVDGVSLTTNSVAGSRFAINLIPHTLTVTTLGDLTPGAGVNIEVDLIARYVERIYSAAGRST